MKNDILFEQTKNEIIVPHICRFTKSPYPAHWQNGVEFLYCYQGEATVYIDSEPFDFKEGDTIVINHQQIHTFESNKKAEWYCLIFSDLFFRSCKLDVSKIFFENKFRDCSATPLLKELCTIYDLKEKDGFWIDIHRLAIEYFNHMYHNHRCNNIKKAPSISRKHATVLKALEFIDNNYTEKITVDEVAKYIGYSRYHFVRMFKEYTDTTVQDIINIKRIEKSKEMLANTTMSIDKIATKCGFENSSYFAKVFKKISDCLPSEYRKKTKKDA